MVNGYAKSDFLADGNGAGLLTQGNLRDIEAARLISLTLEKHYPGFLWAVYADVENGIATVRNFSLSGKWGFYLHLDKNYSASEFEKRVIRAGGELLERYRMPRGAFDEDVYRAAPTLFNGDLVGDVSC